MECGEAGEEKGTEGRRGERFHSPPAFISLVETLGYICIGPNNIYGLRPTVACSFRGRHLTRG